MNVSVDGGPQFTIDYYNETSSSGVDPPVLLYTGLGLSLGIHTVVLTNILDTRFNLYGQMNVSVK